MHAYRASQRAKFKRPFRRTQMSLKLNLTFFSEIKPIEDATGIFLTDIIRNNQKYYEKFCNDDFETMFSSRCFIELYQQLGINLVEKITGLNPHVDLANFRFYFEALNMKEFGMYSIKDGLFFRFIIDVGASSRLYNSMVARICLCPLLSVSDILRSKKFPLNFGTHLLNQTIQQFAATGFFKKKYNFLLNFTDSIYYINEIELLQIFEDFPTNKIVGCGTMHIFKTKPTKSVVDTLYNVINHNDTILMKVVGNESIYEHANRFHCLTYMDKMIIPGASYNLIVTKHQSIDLGQTYYIRFSIVKTLMIEFSPSFFKLPKVINEVKIANRMDANIAVKHAIITWLAANSTNTLTKIITDNVSLLQVKELITIWSDDVQVLLLIKQIASQMLYKFANKIGMN